MLKASLFVMNTAIMGENKEVMDYLECDMQNISSTAFSNKLLHGANRHDLNTYNCPFFNINRHPLRSSNMTTYKLTIFETTLKAIRNGSRRFFFEIERQKG